MPHCVHNDGDRSATDNSGQAGCQVAVHAEANAISFAARYGVALDDAWMYATMTPCLTCAQLVINAGVTTVVAHREYRIQAGVDLLRAAGVKVLYLHESSGLLETIPDVTD